MSADPELPSLALDWKAQEDKRREQQRQMLRQVGENYRDIGALMHIFDRGFYID